MDRADLIVKLAAEMCDAGWTDLQRAWAKGDLLLAASSLDFMDVAIAISEDKVELVQPWIRAGMLGQVSDEQAKGFLAERARFRMLVLQPYVLVQEQEA